MTLTPSFIYQKTKQSDITQIKSLNIWGSNLTNIDILEAAINMQNLSLSVNEIDSLKPLRKMKNLKELFLRRNKISDLKQIQYLRNCKKIESIWLQDNPIENNPEYRNYIIKTLPSITKIDDKPVTDLEKQKVSTPEEMMEQEEKQAQQVQQSQQQSQQEVVKQIQQSQVEQSYSSVQQQINQQKVQLAQQPIPQMRPSSVQQVRQPLQQSNLNRKIMLAVLNLIDELDPQSLQTIKDQVEKLLIIKQ